MYFFLCFVHFLLCFSGGHGEKETLGYPHCDTHTVRGWEMGIPVKAAGNGKAAAIALRAPCSGL